MKQKTIPSWKSFLYSELFEITEIRDNAIFRTKSLGFVSNQDAENYPTRKFCLASISTHMKVAGGNITFAPYLSADCD